MMTKIPLSDVTLIAASLGVFFLIVAFYKSIFHKRRPPTHAVPGHTSDAAAQDDSHPIKLADPFQQVPVDRLPLGHSSQPAPSSFHPLFPQPANPTVSAFRQFNPNKEFESASVSTKNEASYEWE